MRFWKELFDFLEEKVNFRKDPSDGETTWTCEHELDFTKEWCEQNKIPFEVVEPVLMNLGGHCDCEVLFNSVNSLESRPINFEYFTKRQSLGRQETT